MQTASASRLTGGGASAAHSHRPSVPVPRGIAMTSVMSVTSQAIVPAWAKMTKVVISGPSRSAACTSAGHAICA